MKSSTSCVTVVRPKLYLRARLASENIKLALSGYFISCHASSTTSRRLRWSVRTLLQIWFNTIYIATGRNSSSKSRILKTTIWLLISTLLCCEKIPAKVPVVYWRKRCAKLGPLPPICARVSYKSAITGGVVFCVSGSEVMPTRA